VVKERRVYRMEILALRMLIPMKPHLLVPAGYEARPSFQGIESLRYLPLRLGE
jgi:hypothetical protein